MVALVIEHGMEDYDAWKRVFDEHASSRKEHGCTREELFRSCDDGTVIMNVMRYPDRESASAFIEDPSLREAMTRAGVVGAPRITFWETAQVQEF